MSACQTSVVIIAYTPLKLAQPFVYAFLCTGPLILCRGSSQCNPFHYGRPLACGFQFVFCSRQPAAFMCAERYYGLALPAVFFYECIHGHRQVAPPVGITYEDSVVILDCGISLDCRARLGGQFPLGHLRALRVVFWIRRFGGIWKMSPPVSSTIMSAMMRVFPLAMFPTA